MSWSDQKTAFFIDEWSIECTLAFMENKRVVRFSYYLKSDFPCDFSRKPRKFEDIARFKATEFRTILIYYGFIILKDIISDVCYKNFKALSIAMTILLSPHHVSLKQYAHDLLEYFVKSFEQIYGQMYMVHKMHQIFMTYFMWIIMIDSDLSIIIVRLRLKTT